MLQSICTQIIQPELKRLLKELEVIFSVGVSSMAVNHLLKAANLLKLLITYRINDNCGWRGR